MALIDAFRLKLRIRAFERYNKKENVIVKASRYLLLVEPHDIEL